MELTNFSNLTSRIANKPLTGNNTVVQNKAQNDSNLFLNKDSYSKANFDNFFKGIEFLTGSENAVIDEPDLSFASNEPNFSTLDAYLEIDESKVPKFGSFIA